MSDPFGFPFSESSIVDVYKGNTSVAGGNWQIWKKPPGKSFLHILLFGAGGNGGNGAVGLNSTAAGGGGGGSGGQTSIIIPLHMLPNVLYLSLASGGSGITSRIGVYPEVVTFSTIALANAGGNGGNAAGATAGGAGGAGAIATLATMPLAGVGTTTLLAGSAGVIGGVAVAAANLNMPTTGLYLTGGTGGGGLPSTGLSGNNGGAINTATALIPGVPAGAGAGAATTPGGSGSHGISYNKPVRFMLGGTGGGSSHGSATGTGLAGGAGGAGGFGSGGGGGGGALTGSTTGTGGRGGDSYAILSAF